MHHTYLEKETHNVQNAITHSIDDLVKNDSGLLRLKPNKAEHVINNTRVLNREVHKTAINHRLSFYLETTMPQFNIVDYACDKEHNRFISQQKMVHKQ